MSIEKEYFNQILPLGNTPATRSMVAVEVNPTGGVLNLNDVFGPTGGAGHFYEFKADGVPSGGAIYFAISNSPTYGIKPNNYFQGATGGGVTGLGWPLFTNQSITGRLPLVGYERVPSLAGYPSGYRQSPTMVQAPYVHFRTNAGAATGAVLRIRQSSLIPGCNASEGGGFLTPF